MEEDDTQAYDDVERVKEMFGRFAEELGEMQDEMSTLSRVTTASMASYFRDGEGPLRTLSILSESCRELSCDDGNMLTRSCHGQDYEFEYWKDVSGDER